MLIRLVRDNSGVRSVLTCLVLDYNITDNNTLKIKNQLLVFVLLSFFITFINLSTQIWGAQTRFTVVNFGHNQPLPT